MSDAAKIIEFAANGNADAARWLTAYAAFAHLIDDSVDKDKDVTPEQAGKIALAMLHESTFNPWYLANRERLMALVEQAVNAWVDSHTEGNVRVRDVLKGMWHEVIFHAARLCGGWERLRAITGEFRSYDFEKE